MNERIQELIKESLTHLPETEYSGEGWIFDKEQFANLILADVIAIIEDPKSYNRCVFTNFDENRSLCVAQELVKEINQKFKDVK